MPPSWLTSPHNARATTVEQLPGSASRPLRKRRGDVPRRGWAQPDLDKLLIALREGGATTAKGKCPAGRDPSRPAALNKAVDAWSTTLAYGVEHALNFAQRGRFDEEGSRVLQREMARRLHRRRDSPRAARRRQGP